MNNITRELSGVDHHRNSLNIVLVSLLLALLLLVHPKSMGA